MIEINFNYRFVLYQRKGGVHLADKHEFTCIQMRFSLWTCFFYIRPCAKVKLRDNNKLLLAQESVYTYTNSLACTLDRLWNFHEFVHTDRYCFYLSGSWKGFGRCTPAPKHTRVAFQAHHYSNKAPALARAQWQSAFLIFFHALCCLSTRYKLSTGECIFVCPEQHREM